MTMAKNAFAVGDTPPHILPHSTPSALATRRLGSPPKSKKFLKLYYVLKQTKLQTLATNNSTSPAVVGARCQFHCI